MASTSRKEMPPAITKVKKLSTPKRVKIISPPTKIKIISPEPKVKTATKVKILLPPTKVKLFSEPKKEKTSSKRSKEKKSPAKAKAKKSSGRAKEKTSSSTKKEKTSSSTRKEKTSSSTKKEKTSSSKRKEKTSSVKIKVKTSSVRRKGKTLLVTTREKRPKLERSYLKPRNIERDVAVHDWNFASGPFLCRKLDCFGVRDTAMYTYLNLDKIESLAPRVSNLETTEGLAPRAPVDFRGEISDEMFCHISDSCFYTLLHVIRTGMLFMRLSNRTKFKIEDFKKGLSGSHDIDDRPSSIEVDDSVKFALSHLP